jgi:hypothetical protein
MKLAHSLALLGLVCAAAPASAQTGLTIYNDGRVLIRRTVPVTLTAGLTDVRFLPGAMDPSSLVSLDPDVTVVQSRYDAAIDERSVLRRAVGRTLSFDMGGGKTTTAVLLGTDPERWRSADGYVSFSRPGVLRVPEELVTAEPQLELQLRSAKARSGVGLGWFTDGTSWSAAYSVLLRKNGTARVEGAAVIINTALRADSAEIQLVAGSPGRGTSPSAKNMMAMRAVEMVAAAPSGDMAGAGERLGDLRVYALPGRWTLRPALTSTIALFEPFAAKIEKTYEVGGVVPYWGPLLPRGDESDEEVSVKYTLARPAGTEFGDRGIPGGIVRVYDADTQGRLQLVGEANVEHLPAGKAMELGTGTAFDLRARRIQTNYVSRPTVPRQKSGATASYSVTLTNGGDEAVVIDVIESRGGEWSVSQSSVPAEKRSSTTTRFRVPVPAKGEVVLTYTVQLFW